MIRASAPASERMVTSGMSVPSKDPKLRVELIVVIPDCDASAPRERARNGILPSCILGFAGRGVELRQETPVERPAFGELAKARIEPHLQPSQIGCADRRRL